MKKKSQGNTLFQAWGGSKQATTTSTEKPGWIGNTDNTPEVLDLSDDDEDDDLVLALAMSEMDSVRSSQGRADVGCISTACSISLDKNTAASSFGKKNTAISTSRDTSTATFASGNKTSATSTLRIKTTATSKYGFTVREDQNNKNAETINTNKTSFFNQIGKTHNFATECDNDQEIPAENQSLSSSPSAEFPLPVNDLPGFSKFNGRLLTYPTNYPVRDYQLNIVQSAIYQNTLVCLPTGLGKTFIAAVVMYNYYMWYPSRKVVFMAPTKPLVAQQIEACYNIMGVPQSDTVEMTGAMSPSERIRLWKTKHLFFLTPQVLMNDLINGALPSDHVKCLVVDEAHKAQGNHAYCQVVREIVKHTKDFRVLALSATPGSDIKSVQQVITNLCISNIELRTEDSVDIKQYSHERQVDKIVVKLNEAVLAVKQKYLRILKMVVDRLVRMRVLYNKSPDSLSKYVLLMNRDAFRQNPPESLPKSQYGVVEGDFAMCISLYHGYELLQLHGLKPLYGFLEGIASGEKGFGRSRHELLRNVDFCEILEELKEKFHPTNVSMTITPSQPGKPFVTGHPKLDKLQEVVLEHYQKYHDDNGNSNTRIMIFSQYRDSVKEITEMLNQHQPLVKVMNFIGQSSAGKSTKGFTQKEQLQVMKAFREGGYNTLVSTCVGEEGLDIGDVDLIICFDAHKSPIRLVQRMGRTGRKRKGRIVMLVTEGKEEMTYKKSLYSKKSIHNAILNSRKSLEYYPNLPEMIPEGHKPGLFKTYITVTKAFQSKSSKQTQIKPSASSSSTAGVGRKKAGQDGFLSDAEFAYYMEKYHVDEASIPALEKSEILCLKPVDEAEVFETSDHPVLSLIEWLPWQNTLQETDKVSHSVGAAHLVELMEFIDLQGTMGEEAAGDAYAAEMSLYLDESDVLKPGEVNKPDDGILKYLALDKDRSAKGGNPAKTKRKKKRITLPEFSSPEEEVDTDTELPEFGVPQRKVKKIREKSPEDVEVIDLDDDVYGNLGGAKTEGNGAVLKLSKSKKRKTECVENVLDFGSGEEDTSESKRDTNCAVGLGKVKMSKNRSKIAQKRTDLTGEKVAISLKGHKKINRNIKSCNELNYCGKDVSTSPGFDTVILKEDKAHGCGFDSNVQNSEKVISKDSKSVELNKKSAKTMEVKTVISEVENSVGVLEKKRTKSSKRKKKVERNKSLIRTLAVISDDDDGDFEVDPVNKSPNCTVSKSKMENVKVKMSPIVCDKQDKSPLDSIRKDRSGGDQMDMDDSVEFIDKRSEPETLELSELPSSSQPIPQAKSSNIKSRLRVSTPPNLEELDVLFEELGSRDRLSPVDILQLVDIWDAEKAKADRVDDLGDKASALTDLSSRIYTGTKGKTKMSVSIGVIKINPWDHSSDELSSLDGCRSGEDPDFVQLGDICDIKNKDNVREEGMCGTKELVENTPLASVRNSATGIFGQPVNHSGKVGRVGQDFGRDNCDKEVASVLFEGSQKFDPIGFGEVEVPCDMNMVDCGQSSTMSGNNPGCKKGKSEPAYVDAKENSNVLSIRNKGNAHPKSDTSSSESDINRNIKEIQCNVPSIRKKGRADPKSYFSETDANRKMKEIKSVLNISVESVSDDAFSNIDVQSLNQSDKLQNRKLSGSTNSSRETFEENETPVSLKKPLFKGGSAERKSNSLSAVYRSSTVTNTSGNSLDKAKRVRTPNAKDSSVQEAFNVSYSLFDDDFADEISVHGANSSCRADPDHRPFQAYSKKKSSPLTHSKGNLGDTNSITPIKRLGSKMNFEHTPVIGAGCPSPLISNVTSTPVAPNQFATSKSPDVNCHDNASKQSLKQTKNETVSVKGNVSSSLFDDDDDDQLLAAVCEKVSSPSIDTKHPVKSNMFGSKILRASNPENTQITFTQAIDGLLARSESPEDIEIIQSKQHDFSPIPCQTKRISSPSPVSNPNSEDEIVPSTPGKSSQHRSTLFSQKVNRLGGMSQERDERCNLPSNWQRPPKVDAAFTPSPINEDPTHGLDISKWQRPILGNVNHVRSCNENNNKLKDMDENLSSDSPERISPSLLRKKTKTNIGGVYDGRNSGRSALKRKIKFQEEAQTGLGSNDVPEALFDFGEINADMFEDKIFTQADREDKLESCGFEYSPPKPLRQQNHDGPSTPDACILLQTDKVSPDSEDDIIGHKKKRVNVLTSPSTPNYVAAVSPDSEDSIVVRKRKRVNVLTSPDTPVQIVKKKLCPIPDDSPGFKTPTRPVPKQKKAKQILLEISSDDEFESPLVPKLKKLMNQGHSKNVLKKRRHPSAARAFIEHEADLSEDCEDSGDEDEEDLDRLDASFINDNTQMSQSHNDESFDVQAMYMRSVVNDFPGGQGRFKLKYNSNVKMDVFSQVPQEEDSWCSEMDSFINDDVVDDYGVESEAEITICNPRGRGKKSGEVTKQMAQNKQKQCRPTTGRKRIRDRMVSSESDEGISPEKPAHKGSDAFVSVNSRTAAVNSKSIPTSAFDSVRTSAQSASVLPVTVHPRVSLENVSGICKPSGHSVSVSIGSVGPTTSVMKCTSGKLTRTSEHSVSGKFKFVKTKTSAQIVPGNTQTSGLSSSVTHSHKFLLPNASENPSILGPSISGKPESSMPSMPVNPGRTTVPISLRNAGRTLPSTSGNAREHLVPNTSVNTSRTSVPSLSGNAHTSSNAIRTSVPSTSNNASRTSLPSSSGNFHKTSVPSSSGNTSRTSVPSSLGNAHRPSVPSSSGNASRTAVPSASYNASRTCLLSSSGNAHRPSVPSTSGNASRTTAPSSSDNAHRTSVPSSGNAGRTSMPSTSVNAGKTSSSTAIPNLRSTAAPVGIKSKDNDSQNSTNITNNSSGRKFTFKRTASTLVKNPMNITHTAQPDVTSNDLDLNFDDLSDSELFPEVTASEHKIAAKVCATKRTSSRPSFSSKLSARIGESTSQVSQPVAQSTASFQKPQNIHSSGNGRKEQRKGANNNLSNVSPNISHVISSVANRSTSNMSSLSTNSSVSYNPRNSSPTVNSAKSSVSSNSSVQDQLRQERLKRQQLKQEEFRRKMATKQPRY